MAYNLQIPVTVILDGETHVNGYVRMGRDSLTCAVAVQIYDTVQAAVVRGPSALIVVHENMGMAPADIKAAIKDKLIARIGAWFTWQKKELQAETGLQSLIDELKTEFGLSEG